MKLKFTTTFFINTKQEEARIRSAFADDPDQMKKQLAIFNAFKNKDFNKCIDLYNALGYDKVNECNEREYVGMYFTEFFDFCNQDWLVEEAKKYPYTRFIPIETRIVKPNRKPQKSI